MMTFDDSESVSDSWTWRIVVERNPVVRRSPHRARAEMSQVTRERLFGFRHALTIT